MSSVYRGRRSNADTPPRRVHTRWNEDGERTDFFDLGVDDSNKKNKSSIFSGNDKKPAVRNPYLFSTPPKKPVGRSVVNVTPSDSCARVGNAATLSAKSHVAINAANVSPPHSIVHATAPSTILGAHVQKADSPPSRAAKTTIPNPYTNAKKTVSKRTADDSSRVCYIHDNKYEKDFEAALAEPDPHGEARLDFRSSEEYYTSPVYKARNGKPKSEWTQDAYLPAPKGRAKRGIDMISSYAPTFFPAPDDDFIKDLPFSVGDTVCSSRHRYFGTVTDLIPNTEGKITHVAVKWTDAEKETGELRFV